MWSGQYPGPSASVDLKLQNLQWWVLRPTAGDMASCLSVFALHVSEIVYEGDLPSSFDGGFPDMVVTVAKRVCGIPLALS